MKLYYFNVAAKGEAIRLLLTHSQTEFEDIRLGGESFQEFKADKKKCKFGQLPVLEIDGEYHSQSVSILRYLGALNGYYPEDAKLRFRIDELSDLLATDFFTPLIMNIVFTKDAEEKYVHLSRSIFVTSHLTRSEFLLPNFKSFPEI